MFLEAVNQGNREQSADARRQPDGDPPDRRITVGAEVLARMRYQLQDGDAMIEQPLAGLRQRDAASIAHKQGLAQFGFKAAYLAAECRLRDIEHDGGLAEAAQFGHVHEVFELLEIHWGPGALPNAGCARTNARQSPFASSGRLSPSGRARLASMTITLLPGYPGALDHVAPPVDIKFQSA